MPEISIIVPVYDVESFLPRCIESILAQRFVDFELILIDDGSPDGCGEICDNFEAQDSRIKVIHQENAGVSRARNAGLQVAKGQWITFIDSDDWVSPDYLINMLPAQSKERVNLVLSGYHHYCNNQIQSTVTLSEPQFFNRDNLAEIITTGILRKRVATCAKLYNASVIREHELKFLSGVSFGEDAAFLMNTICAIGGDGIIVTDKSDYYYCYDNSTSLTTRIFEYESEWLGLECYFDVVSRLCSLAGLENDYDYFPHFRLIERVLISIYTSENRAERINRLRRFGKYDMRRYVKSNTFFESILNWLLIHKFYGLYHFVRTTVYKIGNQIFENHA